MRSGDNRLALTAVLSYSYELWLPIAMAPRKKSAGMSDAHKAALAEGRAQGRAVRRYLEALEAHKPKRGRKRTPESMKKRLDRIGAELQTADPLKRLQLRQERLDLESELSCRNQQDRSRKPGDRVHRISQAL